MDREPALATATLINNVVRDMLSQNSFSHAHFPEVVDLAVIGTGLGLLQSNIGFVKNAGLFWDSTQWNVAPRPFLDSRSLAYASALSAWFRDDNNPEWANDLPSEIKGPMRKTLKFLYQTNDSFFQAQTASQSLPSRTQHDWWNLLSRSFKSTQIVAMRHLEPNENTDDQQLEQFAHKLRSNNRDIVLHSMDALQRMRVTAEPLVNELRFLADDRDDEIRAKAMHAMTILRTLDESTIDTAIKILDSNTRFVVFSGLFALTSFDTTPNRAIPAINRSLVRALQSCDYEFIGLIIEAFNRWFENPVTHLENELRDDSPEYLEIAVDALQNVRDQLVALK